MSTTPLTDIDFSGKPLPEASALKLAELVRSAKIRAAHYLHPGH